VALVLALVFLRRRRKDREPHELEV
jgi:hypothetical protein